MNYSKKEKEEMFEIYVICYKEMCAEIDELTKPFRFECEEEIQYEYCEKCDEMHESELEYCEECDFLYFKSRRSDHNNTKQHLTHYIEANKYLLEWRAFNYMNKLKSKK